MSTPGAAPDSTAAAPPPTGSGDEPPAALPVGALLSALAQELSHGLQERLHLVVLEARQVGLRATQMILLAVLAALMLCGAWATVLVGLYMACTAIGLSWPLALLAVLVVNVAAAAGVLAYTRRLNGQLGFPATLRMLTHIGHPHPGPDGGAPPGVTPSSPYPAHARPTMPGGVPPT